MSAGWNRFPKEWEEWLIENRFSPNLAEDFYQQFGHKSSKKALQLKIARLGYHTTKDLITKEQKEWFLSRYPDCESVDKLVEEFNKKFHTNKSKANMKSLANKNGVHRNFRARYYNRTKIGTEIISNKNLIYIKTKDIKGHGNELRQNYMPKSVYMYEKYHNVKVPKGYKVIFINGNKRDFSKENLEMVSPSQHMKININDCQNKGIITKALIEVLKTQDLINQK